MTEERIARLNELARKSKTIGLTEEEKQGNRYEQFCKPLENGLYVNTHGSFNDFMTIIRKLKEHSIQIEAEIMTSR